MSTTRRFDPVSVADYLAGEEAAVEKHEYVCGEVYAQAGGTNAHNRIATNATIELGSLLRGHQCRVYNSDTKIRICDDDGARFFILSCRLSVIPILRGIRFRIALL